MPVDAVTKDANLMLLKSAWSADMLLAAMQSQRLSAQCVVDGVAATLQAVRGANLCSST